MSSATEKSSQERNRADLAAESRTLQLHEEQLEARKQFVETGAVRVRKEVVTEHRTLEVPVQREEIIIERHAPNGAPVAASAFQPGEELRIAVREEQVTVEKRPVVTEEVTVGKRVVRETERLGGEVRKEELRVEREGDVDVPAATAPGMATATNGASAPTPRAVEGDEEAEIRRRAYLKWRGEGCPSGQDLRHYFEASREVRA